MSKYKKMKQLIADMRLPEYRYVISNCLMLCSYKELCVLKI